VALDRPAEVGLSVMNLEPWSTVTLGAAGERVRAIQFLLRAHGHVLVVDGAFGPVTAGAVSALQTTEGLPADGVIGRDTWVRLVVPISLGSVGDAVRALQQFWVFEYEPVVDGQYGPVTRNHVLAFQEAWGLTVDGATGQETWSFKVADPLPWPLVKPGATTATNYRVPIVQHLLRAHGAGIAPDGSYGPATGEAVRQFQMTLRALYISTIVGQLDWPALCVTTQLGAAGEAVRAAQVALNAHGHALTVDGAFGPLTDAAARDFQETYSPPVDGVFGPLTWRAAILPKSE
jgi:peptidoglycan hydrolase-like protein with peptidoglycan-binding domain